MDFWKGMVRSCSVHSLALEIERLCITGMRADGYFRRVFVVWCLCLCKSPSLHLSSELQMDLNVGLRR